MALLLESGDRLLLESGDVLLLESDGTGITANPGRATVTAGAYAPGHAKATDAGMAAVAAAAYVPGWSKAVAVGRSAVGTAAYAPTVSGSIVATPGRASVTAAVTAAPGVAKTAGAGRAAVAAAALAPTSGKTAKPGRAVVSVAAYTPRFPALVGRASVATSTRAPLPLPHQRSGPVAERRSGARSGANGSGGNGWAEGKTPRGARSRLRRLVELQLRRVEQRLRDAPRWYQPGRRGSGGGLVRLRSSVSVG